MLGEAAGGVEGAGAMMDAPVGIALEEDVAAVLHDAGVVESLSLFEMVEKSGLRVDLALAGYVHVARCSQH